MKYQAAYLILLRNEASYRFDELLNVLHVGDSFGDDTIQVDGMRARLAADDFKTILAEIRKLK